MSVELIIIGGVTVGVFVGWMAVMPVIKIMPFAYGSSRIRGAKARILKDEELQSFVDKSYKDVVYRLEKHGFSELLELIDSDFREEYVQQKLRKYSFLHLHKVINYVPSAYKSFFEVLQMRQDYDLVIAVLRSKSSSFYARHLIKALFAETKYFSAQGLDEIENMSLDDFVSRLKKTPFYNVVSEHIKDIKKGKLSGVEAALENKYFTSLLYSGKNDNTLKAYAQLLISRYNIREAMSFGNNPTFIKGGMLKKNTLQKLESAKNIEEIKKALENTPFEKHTKDAKDTIEMVNSLFRFSKTFAKKLSKEEPLSIKPFVSYYILKEIELKNIRIILKLIHSRFTPEDISRLII